MSAGFAEPRVTRCVDPLLTMEEIGALWSLRPERG
jgi:hypothetical protein